MTEICAIDAFGLGELFSARSREAESIDDHHPRGSAAKGERSVCLYRSAMYSVKRNQSVFVSYANDEICTLSFLSVEHAFNRPQARSQCKEFGDIFTSMNPETHPSAREKISARAAPNRNRMKIR